MHQHFWSSSPKKEKKIFIKFHLIYDSKKLCIIRLASALLSKIFLQANFTCGTVRFYSKTNTPQCSALLPPNHTLHTNKEWMPRIKIFTQAPGHVCIYIFIVAHQRVKKIHHITHTLSSLRVHQIFTRIMPRTQKDICMCASFHIKNTTKRNIHTYVQNHHGRHHDISPFLR